MKLSAAALSLALLFLFAALPARAGEHAAATIADIVAGMNHFPTDEQKAKLAEIQQDESVDENLRTIAAAVANVQHQPAEADRAELQAIVDDEAATEEAKTLAAAVLNFNHKVQQTDLAALESLEESKETKASETMKE